MNQVGLILPVELTKALYREVLGRQREPPKLTIGLDCVRTFAYWNPAILDAERLLNSQTGEFAEVTVRSNGPQTLDIGPHRVAAEKYTIESGEGPIRLWYAPGGQHWLALEADLESGRTLRYVPLVLPWNAVGETRLALN